jgi:lysophospholipase L1-like esterase
MRVPRLVSATAALAAGAVLAVLGAAPAGAAGANYVALGDSYSSGVGAGSYGDSGDCKRSSNAAASLWAGSHAPASFSFMACSGAKTGDVLADQLGPVDASTTLISISIGGNDAGFSDVMTTCALSSESTCLDRVATAESYANNTLPQNLDSVYSAIKSKAPSAKVVVLDYPHLYQIGGSCLVGLSDAERSAINGAADAIDDVIKTRATAAGFTFGDVRPAFTGHEICSDDEWLNSVTLPVDESYHPTAAGQSGGYLPVLTSAAG